MNYNERNAHERDGRIRFEPDSHTYTAIGESDGDFVVCESVTTVVERLFAQFDADYWAVRKATAECSAEQLKELWARRGEEARNKGTLLHDRIERFYLGEVPDDEALADKAFCNFLMFAEMVPLTPYRSEWHIFSGRARLAGTLDFLAYDGEKFEIYDWKRSSKLVDATGKVVDSDRYGRHAFAPLEHVPDTTFHHYALQVSLYRYILETEYGIEVSAGHLGTFHPDYDRPYVIDLPYLRAETETIINSRCR